MWWPGAALTAQAVTDLQHRPMELRYRFDPEKWYLGTPCIHGHYWPGTELSLRQNYKRANRCAGCKTNPECELPWLFKFIDLEASGVPAGQKLGKLCSKLHSWNNTGFSLRRRSGGHCVECESLRTRDSEKAKARSREHYLANRDQYLTRSKKRYEQRKENGQRKIWLEQTKQKRCEYKRRQRIAAGVEPFELIALRSAIRRAGRLKSVARLVYETQQHRWKLCPQEKAEHDRWWSAELQRFRYLVDPSQRLYHRSKSKQRKARERGSRTVRLTPDQLWRRWVEFDHCCAYCGVGGDMQVEHVVPISKGGEHHLGNIVPACQRCNFSKGKSDAETWYRAQPFFDETRWLRIVQALANGRPQHHQPSLLVA